MDGAGERESVDNPTPDGPATSPGLSLDARLPPSRSLTSACPRDFLGLTNSHRRTIGFLTRRLMPLRVAFESIYTIPGTTMRGETGRGRIDGEDGQSTCNSRVDHECNVLRSSDESDMRTVPKINYESRSSASLSAIVSCLPDLSFGVRRVQSRWKEQRARGSRKATLRRVIFLRKRGIEFVVMLVLRGYGTSYHFSLHTSFLLLLDMHNLLHICFIRCP
jgi:hypothetical protein